MYLRLLLSSLCIVEYVRHLFLVLNITAKLFSGYTMTAIDTDVRSVQRMFDVNVFGPMRMVHYFHSMLIRSSGTIVSIGSIGGIVPYIYGCRFGFSNFHNPNVALSLT
jgi:NADP-dependent 3-hydroxy acid dehydrogenase YdfG